MTATQWAEKVGINRNVITKRIKNGWDKVASVLTPL